MRRRRVSAAMLAVFFLLLGTAATYLLRIDPITDHITPGLDLAGGVRVVMQARDTPDAPVTPESMETAREVIRKRVDELGVAEPIIQLAGTDRIVVELPGTDPERALEVIGRTAQLEFRDPEDRVILTGANLVRAQASLSPAGVPMVLLRFDGEGREKFAEATSRLVGRPIQIVIDGEVLTAPQVREPIPTGEAQITGIASLEEAQNLAISLSSGALPVELEIVENRSVSAFLGEESVAQSTQAAVYAIIAVVAFMMGAYRLSGLMANAALVLYLLVLFAVLAGINATLTLPGIAGIILSVGMAVDANVIIFERIREELRAGNSVRSSIEVGFRNAVRAILDANVTTLLAAAALFTWGTGPVQGFAVTLSIGVLCSMVTAIFVTRFLIRHLVDTEILRDPGRLFGVKEAVKS